jgi:PKD repeat protein
MNTITAIATSPAGQSVTTTVTITATGSIPDLVLQADITQGVTPLSVTFTYELRSNQTIDKLAIDFNGDGRDDFSTRKPPPTVQNTYTTPGLYVATLTITDGRGVHKASIGIEVGTTDARDSLFRSVWDAMNAALVRGDVNGALSSLNARAQEKYGRVFNGLVADMPAIVGSYSSPQFVSAGQDYLEYAISRYKPQALAMDAGWRMDSM